MSEATDFMLFSAGANAIAGWRTLEAAYEYVRLVAEQEPEAIDEITLVSFDAEGMAIAGMGGRALLEAATSSP